jgi:hypothetical protein
LKLCSTSYGYVAIIDGRLQFRRKRYLWILPPAGRRRVGQYFRALTEAKRWAFRWLLDHPAGCNGAGAGWLAVACADPTARALLTAAEDGDKDAPVALLDRLQELQAALDVQAVRQALRECGYPVRALPPV